MVISILSNHLESKITGQGWGPLLATQNTILQTLGGGGKMDRKSSVALEEECTIGAHQLITSS